MGQEYRKLVFTNYIDDLLLFILCFRQSILMYELFLLLQLDATGRPDESLVVEFVGPLKPNSETHTQSGQLLSFFLQKGQLKANICFQPFHSASLEVHVIEQSYYPPISPFSQGHFL